MDRQTSSENSSHRPRKKRRTRVSKACDECRVRKIRCDGGQPCEPCEAFDRVCLYRTSRFHKLGSSHHLRALEESIYRARNYIEELHKSYVPKESQKDLSSIFASANEFKLPSLESESSGQKDGSPMLENMMENQEQLTLADRRTASFYGDSSGFAFLQKTKQLFDDAQGSPHDTDISQSTEQAITRLFDAPLPDKQALDTDVPVSHLLPSRQSASDLLQVVFAQVYPLLQFLHAPSFQERTDRIYDIDPMEYDDSDHDFLPLLFAVLGLGFLFSQKKHQQYGCRRAVIEGMRHFIAARQMVDVTNCRDIETLQTLICFILFLMSTARLVTSHTYTGLALASAIRLGLHSQGPVNDAFTADEQEERRRVFETIVKIDIYTSSVLGLPTLTDLPKLERTLRRDIDLDLESSQKYSSKSVHEGIAIAAGAKHLEVLLIIARTTNTLYPDRAGPSNKDIDRPTFLIHISEIMDLERDFKRWRESLPQSLQLNASNEAFERCDWLDPVYLYFYLTSQSLSYELEMVHNFGHIALYRPFIHYLAKARSENPPDKRQLRCALACVKISKRTIQRSVEIQRQGYLAPASWNSVYTIFLSILTLIFFLACQGDSREAHGIKQVTEAGLRILASCECQDTGSRRCLDVIRVLLKRLSHILELDIDKIRKETPSLCQSKYPGDRGKAPLLPSSSSDSNKTEKPTRSPPPHGFLDWTGNDPSPSMEDAERSRWQPATTQPFMYSTDTAFSVQNPINLLSPGYTSQLDPHQQSSSVISHTSDTSNLGSTTSNTSGPISSLDASATLQIPEQPGAGSGGDQIEIPYAESFAWPFQSPTALDQFGNEGEHDTGLDQNYDEFNSHPQLTAEDIAAFMRINPASDPFL